MRAVFLDRDGIINQSVVKNGKPFPPDSLESLQWVPQILESCEKLVSAGFRLIIVTNQPDVAKKLTKQESVEAIHAKIFSYLPINDIFVCYHTDANNCMCRKPLPGMIKEAAKKWSIDLSESYMIGDRWRDVEAGFNAGCHTLFVDYGYQESLTIQPNKIVQSVKEAVAYILSRD